MVGITVAENENIDKALKRLKKNMSVRCSKRIQEESFLCKPSVEKEWKELKQSEELQEIKLCAIENRHNKEAVSKVPIMNELDLISF